jgi:26S proteasome regulatory subunit T2
VGRLPTSRDAASSRTHTHTLSLLSTATPLCHQQVEKAPLESYADVGGLEPQIQEIKEAVELPLTHPELYEEIGIKAPKGVILYGEPGTGKVRDARIFSFRF